MSRIVRRVTLALRAAAVGFAVLAGGGAVSACGGGPGNLCILPNVTACRERCEAGDGESCAMAAAMIDETDVNQITELFLSGCLRAYAPSCYAAGLQYLIRESPKPQMATKSFEAGCQLGHVNSCAMKAALAEADGTLAEASALAVYNWTCTSDGAVGCSFAGDHLLTGRGVAADPQRGAELLRKACNLGEPTACKRAKATPNDPPNPGPLPPPPPPPAPVDADARPDAGVDGGADAGGK